MKNRKGFTIVELVIVIAVIAILAAVLIPTFSGVVGKANVSARTQEFTNALKVVLAGNAETGALADGTIFVSSSNNKADYYAYYNGNKLGSIIAIDKSDTVKRLSATTTYSSNVATSSSVAYYATSDAVAAADPAVTIKSVIVKIGDNNEIEDNAKAAILAFFGASALTYNNNKIDLTIDANTLTLNCYQNLDLANGMFVLSPTN